MSQMMNSEQDCLRIKMEKSNVPNFWQKVKNVFGVPTTSLMYVNPVSVDPTSRQAKANVWEHFKVEQFWKYRSF